MCCILMLATFLNFVHPSVSDNLSNCPCVFDLRVDYDCLLAKIKETPISPSCMRIIQNFESNNALKFHLNTGERLKCSDLYGQNLTLHHFPLIPYRMTFYYDTISSEQLSSSNCENEYFETEFKQYILDSDGDNFYNFVAKNLVASKNDPTIFCELHFLLAERTTCTATEPVGYFYHENITFSQDSVDVNGELVKPYTYPLYEKLENTLFVRTFNSSTASRLGSVLFSSGTLHRTIATVDGKCMWGLGTWYFGYNEIYSLTMNPSGRTLSLYWTPTLRSLRVYENSSVAFSLVWDCPAFDTVPKYLEVKCRYFMEKNQSLSTEESQIYNILLGPVGKIKIQPEKRTMTFEVRTGFANNTDKNGALTTIPTPHQEVSNMFKYDYFNGYFARYNISSSKIGLPDLLKRNYSYFLQSVILPGPQKIPTRLTTLEIFNLTASCVIEAVFENNEDRMTSDSIDLSFRTNIQHLKLFATISPPSISPNSSDYIKTFLVEYEPYNEFKNTVIWTDEYFSLVTSTLTGAKKIASQTSAELWNDVEKWNNVPWFYRRRVGCYHSIFQRWYVFIYDSENSCFVMASAQGDFSNYFWEQITWTPHLNVEFVPITMECPQVHSFLVWTELDDKGGVQVFKLRLVSETGIPTGAPEELSHRSVCGPDEEGIIPKTVTSPVIGLASFTDLDGTGKVELGVVCGTYICWKIIEPLQSDPWTRCYNWNNIATDLVWFSHTYGNRADQVNIFLIDAAANWTIQVRVFKSFDEKESYYKLNHQFEVFNYNTGKSGVFGSSGDPGDEIPRFFAVFSPKDEEFAPVPPAHCIFPQIISINVIILSDAAAKIVLEHKFSTSSNCVMFAKPAVTYKIQYTQLFESIVYGKKLSCTVMDEYIDKLRCMTSFTNSSRTSPISYILGNLKNGKSYFIEATAEVDLPPRLLSLWFSGAQRSVAKKVMKVKYETPTVLPGYIKAILGTAGIIVAAALILIILLIWHYQRKTYLYQGLSRLSAREILREEKIGEGNFGQVWKAQLHTQTVVIKILKPAATDREEKEFREEALLLSKFDNDFIIKALGICLQTRPIMLALEYMNGGALNSYLKRADVRNVLKAEDLLKICKDAVQGCIYLEREGYIHRDLSARNCLVSTVRGMENIKPHTVKLSDFGLARDIGQESDYRSRDPDADMLPIAWTSPEAFSGKFGHQSDVWAFGVLMWEVFTFGAQPFGLCSLLIESHRCPLLKLTHSEIEYQVCVEKKILTDHTKPCSAAFCPALESILGHCWKYDFDQRPSFIQVDTYLKGATAEILCIEIPGILVHERADQDEIEAMDSGSAVGLMKDAPSIMQRAYGGANEKKVLTSAYVRPAKADDLESMELLLTNSSKRNENMTDEKVKFNPLE